MAGSKQLEQTSKSIGSSAHMITTARVPADKPVRIAFSLNETPDDDAPENSFALAFPELDQQLQPLPPCHDSTESMQVYKQHCKIAEEYHEVKKEIALLEERNRYMHKIVYLNSKTILTNLRDQKSASQQWSFWMN
ncbi:MAP3K7 C-terminal-like protein isoform X3 [Cygnus olor]|uniref:MAP3K7 C-terminal-like protein isoform X3 n=1 Tax=Cygnus olor TaxID=8869 RepID=UPI001ADE803F|nr:MAP3K7 C-terminal-like protein isoform X3 [Cygnus olor]